MFLVDLVHESTKAAFKALLEIISTELDDGHS